MRINADKGTVGRIRTLIYDQLINQIPQDCTGYDLQVFNNPSELYQAILAIKNLEYHLLQQYLIRNT